MFARAPGAGSLYWLCTRDSTGFYLDGTKSYTLEVPQPVPATLFWSLTVYDARTRSENFGPELPPDGVDDGRWIQTLPGVGWFVYFRIYGPERPAFNREWQLPDFQITS
jgi:hypothetical protein